MKKLLLTSAFCLLTSALVSAQSYKDIRENQRGTQIGKSGSQVSFFGVEPQSQPAATAPTRTALQTLGLLAADGTITATATGTGGTSTVTLNKTVGTITTGAITTAAAATHVMTVTNSTVNASSVIVASINQNSSGGLPVITSIEPGSGSFVIRITNLHATAAFDAPLKINFGVIK